jgi:hypothetical protein
MRKTLPTAALMLLLSCPAFAGEMNNPNSPTPPPPTVEEPAGDTTLSDGAATSDASAPLMQITLELLAILPSLL